MSSENNDDLMCPFPDIVRPPYNIGRRAGDLAFLIGYKGEFSPSIIPPVPDSVIEALGSKEEVARYEQDAAFAVDALYFAMWLREPDQDQRLKELDYSPLWKRKLPFIPDKVADKEVQEKRVHRAVTVYGRYLGRLANEHMKNPDLQHLRQYRKIKQEEAGNNRSLWRSYRGRVVLEMTMQALNADYFRHDFSRSEAEVLQASLRELSFIGTLPRIRAVALPPLPRSQQKKAPWEYRGMDLGKIVSSRALRGLFGAHQGTFAPFIEDDDSQYLRLDRHKIRSAFSNQKGPLPHPPDVGRSNNSCPAVVSIPGMGNGNSSGELIAEQMIDMFKVSGVIFED